MSQLGVLDTARYIHQEWLSQQRKAVLTTIGLTEFEKASFWPVYESYCRAKEYLELEYLNIMLVYSDYLNTSNQGYAERLYRLLLNNDCELAKIRLKYYRQICRALPTSKANAFMQLDNSFRAFIRDGVSGKSYDDGPENPIASSADQKALMAFSHDFR
jgi:hypothetical protein